MYKAKFNYNLVTDISPEQLYQKAIEAKESYHKEMYSLAQTLWPKYAKDITRPTDSLLLIKTIIDKVSEKHVSPKNLMDTIRSQVSRLQAFIKRKDLFDYDTSYPLQVRVTPSYASGFSVASANFPPPYQKTSITYYNIDDSQNSAEKAGATKGVQRYVADSFYSRAMQGHCRRCVYSKNQSGMVNCFFKWCLIEGWLYTWSG